LDEVERWRQELAVTFKSLVTRQYDTDVDPAELETSLEGHLSEGVQFRDPWQVGIGKELYLLGQRGFHAMFWFHLETHQLAVEVDERQMTARVLVDATMVLEQLRPLFVYPLRTLLVYSLRLERPASPELPVGWQILEHEEMWSFGDMLANTPFFGWAYGWFRYGFSRAFLAASWFADLLARHSVRYHGEKKLRRED
jgi:hypothetical protein